MKAPINTYILAISLGLVILFIIELPLSGGESLNFSEYSLAGWIFQILMIIVVVSAAIQIVNDANKPKD